MPRPHVLCPTHHQSLPFGQSYLFPCCCPTPPRLYHRPPVETSAWRGGSWEGQSPFPRLSHWTVLTNTFAQPFSFNHLQAKSTCLKKRCKHRNSGRIPSLIGSLTPAHGRLSRNMINNFCKRIISHPVKSQYLKYQSKGLREALHLMFDQIILHHRSHS